MKNSSVKFLEARVLRFKRFRQALTGETDRGCALYAAAYLDQAISDLLYLSLVYTKDMEKDLFKGIAPLASFSNRITFAYYLGKISPSMRHELDLIRRIRNDFAHSAENITFETEKISNRCENLKYSYHKSTQCARANFTAAVCGALAIIEITGLTSVAPVERVDNIPTNEEKEKHRNMIEEFMSHIDDASTTKR